MYLRTATDKSGSEVTIERVFTAENGRTFLVLQRLLPYAGCPPRFLAEMTDEQLSKRLRDGSLETYPKMIVHQGIPAEELDFVSHKTLGVHKPPLFGMKRLKAVTGGGKLKFLDSGAYGPLVRDQVFKFVSAQPDER